MLELNIKIINLLSEKRKSENYRFRSFLKMQDTKKVDEIVQRLNNEIVWQIDCTNCANCCKILGISVTDDEIERLAKTDNLPVEIFIDNFIKQGDFANEKFLKDKSCKYLEKNKCTIYKNRPEDCKSYPHVNKKNFTTRTFAMLDNYGVCPIVFNVMERLKIELRFR
jgi:uncharacterized protein